MNALFALMGYQRRAQPAPELKMRALGDQVFVKLAKDRAEWMGGFGRHFPSP